MKLNISQLEFPKASLHTSKALDIISTEDPDLNELERVIMQDPILAGTVIRYANSPLYRATRNVSNVPMAIQLLGIKSVRSAIITASIRAILPEDNQISKIVSAHLTGISIISRLIAEKCCPSDAFDLEFIGLFHDIGMLILAVNLPKDYATLVTKSLEDGIPIDTLELQHFGLNHGEVSDYAAVQFRLPDSISDSVKNFHKRDNQLNDNRTCILALAHVISKELAKNTICESASLDKQHLKNKLSITDVHYEDIRLQAKNAFCIN